MTALPFCEDAFEPPGEWEEYVDGDLSDGMELPATGTDWQKLPPEALAEALHGRTPEDQDELLSAAFGDVGGPYTTSPMGWTIPGTSGPTPTDPSWKKCSSAPSVASGC